MIKVTDTVLELIQSDELAIEAARAGLLNLSAYADKILPQIENLTKKLLKKELLWLRCQELRKSLKVLWLP